MIVARDEAIQLASFIKMLNMDEEERKDKMESALLEEEVEPETEGEKSSILRRYIENKFSTYLNTYLVSYLKMNMGIEVEVEGERPELATCVCCGYKTLDPRGFDICTVCFWQEDGVTDELRISAPNYMTLGEGRMNFNLYGACNQSSLKFLHKDRFLQFAKDDLFIL